MKASWVILGFAMYNKIYRCLDDLAGMINVKHPGHDYLNVLAGLLDQKIKTNGYLSTVFASLISTYSKNSFPKFADFQNVISENRDDTRFRPQDWMVEYGGIIGKTPEQISKMKYDDYTDYQKQQLNLLNPEEFKLLNDKIKPTN